MAVLEAVGVSPFMTASLFLFVLFTIVVALIVVTTSFIIQLWNFRGLIFAKLPDGERGQSDGAKRTEYGRENVICW